MAYPGLAAPTNVTLATTAFAPTGTPPRPATGTSDELATSHRRRPSVGQPHRRQRHEVRRRRHIPGNIDQDVGRRRREHEDGASRRQLRDHLIGDRATSQVVHTRRIRKRPTREHRGVPRPANSTHQRHVGNHRLRTDRHTTTTRNRDLDELATSHRRRPSVGQPHRRQRYEVRRRRHIPGNIDQDVGRRRREHADGASRRQLRDHLIGDRIATKPGSSHSTYPGSRPTREHRGVPRPGSTHQRHVGNHRLRTDRHTTTTRNRDLDDATGGQRL